MRTSTLFALKINISDNLFSYSLPDLKQYFFKGITSSKKFINDKGSVWGFINIHKVELNEKKLIAGTLCRGKDQTKKTVDPETKQLMDETMHNVAFQSNFLFDFTTEIVVFEEKSGIISRYQFEKMFKKIILSHAPELGNLVSKLLPAPKLLTEIDKFSRINFAKFNINPANWEFDEHFDELDNKLKELKVQRTIQTYHSKDGIERNAQIFKDAINMSLAGYGDFQLRGKDREGKRKFLKSSEELLSDNVKIEQDTLEEFILKSLYFLDRAIVQHRGGKG